LTACPSESLCFQLKRVADEMTTDFKVEKVAALNIIREQLVSVQSHLNEITNRSIELEVTVRDSSHRIEQMTQRLKEQEETARSRDRDSLQQSLTIDHLKRELTQKIHEESKRSVVSESKLMNMLDTQRTLLTKMIAAMSEEESSRPSKECVAIHDYFQKIQKSFDFGVNDSKRLCEQLEQQGTRTKQLETEVERGRVIMSRQENEIENAKIKIASLEESLWQAVAQSVCQGLESKFMVLEEKEIQGNMAWATQEKQFQEEIQDLRTRLSTEQTSRTAVENDFSQKMKLDNDKFNEKIKEAAVLLSQHDQVIQIKEAFQSGLYCLLTEK